MIYIYIQETEKSCLIKDVWTNDFFFILAVLTSKHSTTINIFNILSKEFLNSSILYNSYSSFHYSKEVYNT